MSNKPKPDAPQGRRLGWRMYLLAAALIFGLPAAGYGIFAWLQAQKRKADECFTRPIREFAADTVDLHAVAFNPREPRLVASGYADVVRLWDIETGECVRTLSGHEGPRYSADVVNSVAVSPDGRQCSSAGGNEVKLWDVATGECLWTMRGHAYGVASVAFSPDGRRCLSGSYDQTLRLWNAETGELVRMLSGHKEHISSIAFVPDGRQCISGSYDQTIKLWDVTTGECLRTIDAQHHVSSVAVSPDGRRFLSGGSDAGGRYVTIRLWSAATGACLQTMQPETEYTIHSVVFSPDGRRCFSSGEYGPVRLWDLASGQEIGRFVSHEGPIHAVAVSPDGRRLVSCGGISVKKGPTIEEFFLWRVPTDTELWAWRLMGGKLEELEPAKREEQR